MTAKETPEVAPKEKTLEEKLQEKRNAEAEAFQEEYKALMEKYGYRLSPIFTIKETGIVPALEIVSTR